LRHPNNVDHFVLDTDASFEGMGAVLSQIQNNKEVVIAYASKKFTKSEKAYCVTRKELLAVHTFTLQYRHYLLGKTFTIRTDHKALIWMMDWKKPNTTQYCSWIADLEIFDFEIKHRPGVEHTNADSLSRQFSCEQCPLNHLEPKKKRNVKIIRLIEDGEHLNLEKKELITKLHQTLGHIGETKTFEIMSKYYNWKGLSEDVKRCIENCLTCAERKGKGNTRKRNQYHIQAVQPFHKIMIDITGPLPRSKKGFTYILGIIDVFSRYVMFIPLKRTNSKDIIDKLYMRWISIFGVPEQLIADNAPNLNSQEMKSFCNKLGIKMKNSSPYYPQGNGIIERTFKTLKDMLYATTKSSKLDWSQVIHNVEMGLRMSKNNVTKFTPNEIIFGNNLRVPNVENITRLNGEKNTWINERIKIWQDILYRQTKTVNQNPRYQIGDKVMVKTQETGLLKKKYIGPGKIIKIISPTTYDIILGTRLIRRNEFHLKRFNGQYQYDGDSSCSAISLNPRKEQTVDRVNVPGGGVPVCGEKKVDTIEGSQRYPSRARVQTQRFRFL
jgi:transposase InsO family protein